METNLTRLKYIKAFNTLDIVEYSPNNNSEAYKLRRSLMPNFVSGIYYDYDKDLYYLKVRIGRRSFKVTDKFYDFISACIRLDELIKEDPLIHTKPTLNEDGTARRSIDITGKEIEFIIRWRDVLDMEEMASILDISMSEVGAILQKAHSNIHTDVRRHTVMLWDVRDKYKGGVGEGNNQYLTNSVDEFLDL